jgi:hypothetical protein
LTRAQKAAGLVFRPPAPPDHHQNGALKMAEQTLTHAQITDAIHGQYERLNMCVELAGMAIESLPNTTDSDPTRALLTGLKEILSTDFANMSFLFDRLTHQAANAANEG